MYTPSSYNVLIYGGSGTGKTEFAGTWPKPILYIDTDKGILTLLASPRINMDEIWRIEISNASLDPKVRQPVGFLYVKGILTALADTGMFDQLVPKTVVLDSLTTTSGYCMDHVLFINKHVGQQPTLPDWGRQMRELLEIIKLGVGLDMNFICVAHEQTQRDELSGRVWKLPLITGKLAGELSLYFDEVYYAEVKPKGSLSEYKLTTKATGMITAKSRLDLPNPINTTFASIEGTIERINKRSQHPKNP